METIKKALRESYQKYSKEELVEILVDISQIYVSARVFSHLCGSNVEPISNTQIADEVSMKINDISERIKSGFSDLNKQQI